jgi:outer membrane receptor protein involved in Fe transport
MPVADQLSNPDLKLFDVERIEILRGPQGTLYGEGSMGGTIHIITNQPDTSGFYGNIEGTGAAVNDGDPGYALNGMVNIPLIEDKLAVRLVAYGRDYGGWIDNLYADNSDKNVNDEETVGYRAALKWWATDNLGVTLMAMHQDTDAGGQNADGGYDTFLAGGFLASIRPSAVDRNEIHQPIDEIINDEYDRYNLRLEYGLPFADLISVSSWFDRERGQSVNTPEIAVGRGLLEGHTLVDASSEIFTQEIRLVSTGQGPLDWTVGVFYKDSDRTETQFDQSNSMIDALTYIGSGFTVIVPGEMSSLVVANEINVKQSAIFGDVTYWFHDSWSASFGLRYFEEEQKSKASLAGTIGFDANTVLGQFGVPFDFALLGSGVAIDVNGVVPDGSFEQDDDATNPRFNLSYTPNDDTLIYGTISQGFRSGGVNVFAHAQLLGPALGLLPPIIIKPSYDSDSLWNYELGLKSMWLGGRMSFNGAIFYQDWSDVQVAEVSNGAFVITNGGAAHSAGIEAEINWLASESLEFSLGGAWIEAEFDEDLPTGAFLKGDRLPDVPDYNLGLAATYSFTVFDNLDGFLRGDFLLVGSQSLIRPAFDSSETVDGYGNINLRLGIDAERWYAQLFVDNLTDEDAELTAEFSRGGYYRLKPRTIGLTVGLHF